MDFCFGKILKTIFLPGVEEFHQMFPGEQHFPNPCSMLGISGLGVFYIFEVMNGKTFH